MEIGSTVIIPRRHHTLTPEQLAFGLWLDESDTHVVKLMFKDHLEAMWAIQTYGPTEPTLQDAADEAMKKWQAFFGEIPARCDEGRQIAEMF